MNVSELIEVLRQVPEDTVVMVDGYEGDYTVLRATNIRVAPLSYKGYDPEYSGEYEEPLFDEDKVRAINAIVLGRY